MRFGPLPLREALGEILAHNISDASGRRVLRKGRVLGDRDVEVLEKLGHRQVFVARLDPDDIHEDEAAERIARISCGSGLEPSTARTGRVDLHATTLGVVRIDLEALRAVNGASGVTVATVPRYSVAHPGTRVATVKIIPYAVPRAAVESIESGGTPVASLDRIDPGEACLVLVGGRGAWEKMASGLGRAIEGRIESLGCRVSEPKFVPLDEGALANTLQDCVGVDPVLLVVAGETAIMDLDDLIPRGLRRAGGDVEDLGLAMDPGQLLLLGYLEGIPVVGAPGCVRGSVPDGFDAVVPRLLAGERLTRSDLHEMAHGGLLSNPRSR